MTDDRALAPLRDELDAQRAALEQTVDTIAAVTAFLDAAAQKGIPARVEHADRARIRIAIDLVASPPEISREAEPAATAEPPCAVAATPAAPDAEPSVPRQKDDRGWNAAEIAELRRMRGDKATVATIAAALDRSEQAIKSKLHALSLTDAVGKEPAKARPAAWTAEEDETAVRMYRNGATIPEIAAAVGRPVPGTTFRLKKLRARLNLPKRAERPKVTAVPATPPAKADPPKAAAASPSKLELVEPAQPVTLGGPGGLTIAQREVAARLANLPFSDWTHDDDLDLVEAVVRGEKIDAVAGELERDRADCLGRWKLLCPMPSPAAQADLMVVLRRRVAEARGAA